MGTHLRESGQRSGATKPVISYKVAIADMRVTILPGGYLDKLFSSEEAGLIRTGLIAGIAEIEEGTSAPRFSEAKLWGGILHESC